MKSLKLVTVAIISLFIAGCATTGDGVKWKCTANNIVNFQYNGSDYAMIHLSGYDYGNRYKVEKNAKGTEARGTTTDGTPFVCSKEK